MFPEGTGMGPGLSQDGPKMVPGWLQKKVSVDSDNRKLPKLNWLGAAEEGLQTCSEAKRAAQLPQRLPYIDLHLHAQAPIGILGIKVELMRFGDVQR